MKKHFCFSFFVCIVLSITGYPQNYIAYYAAMNQAKVLMIDSNYTEAYLIIQKAFTKNEPLTNDLVIAYNCAIKLGKHRTAKKYIYAAIEKGYPLSNLQYLEPSNRNKLKERKINSAYKKYITTVNIDYSIDLLYLLIADQGVRTWIIEYSDDSLTQSIYQNDSLFRENYQTIYYRFMRLTDSINYYELFSKIQEKGLYERKLLFDAYGVADLILNHSIYLCESYNNCDTILSYLKEQVIKGNLSPKDYSRIIDRYFYWKNNMFYYGIMCGSGSMLFEPENANKRRTNIGLPTFEQQERISGRKIIFKNFNNDFDN